MIHQTIEFVISNPRHHVGMFLPVIAWLRENAQLALRVVSLCELRGYRTPAGVIEKAGAESIRVLSVRLSKDSTSLRAARERVAGRERKFLQQLVWQYLVRWDEKSVRRPRPVLAVVPNDHVFPYDRIVERYASGSVPFMLMQEGIRFDLPTHAVGWPYGMGGARAIAAWGPSSAQYFRDVGVPPHMIYAIGNPRLDTILESDWSGPANALRSSLGLGGNVLLYLSNPIDRLGFASTEAKHRLFREFLDASAAFLSAREFQLVAKIHPAESLPAYRLAAQASAARDYVTVIRDAETYGLLALAKGVVILGSTVGLEALLFDLPLAVLEIPGVGVLYDFVDAGVAVPLRTDGELAGRLAKLVESREELRGARTEYLDSQIANRGRSAEAAGQLILTLVT